MHVGNGKIEFVAGGVRHGALHDISDGRAAASVGPFAERTLRAVTGNENEDAPKVPNSPELGNDEHE
jgi:hypothetical protein